jgi:ABC-2 type transport system permease protein
MKTLSIALKDLQIFFKDRGSILYLFILPIIFIALFASIGAAMDLGSEERVIPLAVVNLDPGTQKSDEFLDALLDSKQAEVTLYEEADARDLINKKEIDFILFIPVNLDEDLKADKKVYLKLLIHPNAQSLDVNTVERIANKAGRAVMLFDYFNANLKMFRTMQAMNPRVQRIITEERIRLQAEKQEEQSKDRPLVSVLETTPAAIAGQQEAELPELGQVAALGFTIMFVFLAAQNTAQSIFDEKRMGTFRRLLISPISKSGLLGGKLIPNFILTLVQVVVMLLAGVLLLPLLGVAPLNLSTDPFALVLSSLAIALCSTSLGILIAGLAKTQAQVGGISNIILWIAALIGGSIVPTFLLPDLVNSIARFVPHYWANQAYYGLILRGETLVDVWTDIVVLLIFTLVFFLIGVWRFKFE